MEPIDVSLETAVVARDEDEACDAALTALEIGVDAIKDVDTLAGGECVDGDRGGN